MSLQHNNISLSQPNVLVVFGNTYCNSAEAEFSPLRPLTIGGFSFQTPGEKNLNKAGCFKDIKTNTDALETHRFFFLLSFVILNMS